MYANLGPGQMIDLEPPSPTGVDLLYSHEYVANRFRGRRPPRLSPAERTNLYAYVTNNPINYVDPWGLQAAPGSGGFWDSISNSWGSMQNTYAGLISDYWYGDPNAANEFHQQAYNRGPLGQTAGGPAWSYYGTRVALGVATTATAGAVVVGGAEVAVFGRSAICASRSQSSILVEGAAVGGRIGRGGLFQIRPTGQEPWFRLDYHPFPPYGRPMPHIDSPPFGWHHWPWQ
jgi:hypothetical protein